MKNKPLSHLMRPKNIDEYIGQKHILGDDKILTNLIKRDRLTSIILYGPPGTGKTSLANVIANTTKNEFVKINATNLKKTELEDCITKIIKKDTDKATILFIDEAHRMGKPLQDMLLPYIEDTSIIFIGATTENPFFSLQNALLSRSNLFELKPIETEDILLLIEKTIKSDIVSDLYGKVLFSKQAKEYLALNCNGDCRYVLNIMELAMISTKSINNELKIGTTKIKECMQNKVLLYDKDGDNHYDIISAFIKSMRGSDPQAAIYYLAKMILAGEDINFISRRIMIFASEDIGNADPRALEIATNGSLAVERIGMPEARIILSQMVSYMACAPKSNSSYLAIDKAIEYIKTHSNEEVPNHLKDGHYDGAKTLSHGIDYIYPHNFENHYVEQQYLPSKLNSKFLDLSNIGYEQKLKNYAEIIGNRNI